MTQMRARPPREPTQPGGPETRCRRRTAPARGTAPRRDGLCAARSHRLWAGGSTGGAAPRKTAEPSAVLEDAASRWGRRRACGNGRRRTA
eukprot:5990778-Alexandrium_andersonii.AAC.2